MNQNRLNQNRLNQKIQSFKEFRRSTDEFNHRTLNRLMYRVSRLRLREAFIGSPQNQIKIPYLEGGSGTPLIFLHGFADQKETWSILSPRFVDRHRVLVPDMPGYGDATLVSPDQATIQAQGKHLQAFLDRIGIYGPVHLCGNSMGGGIALEFAKNHPERVASLCLISTMGPTHIQSDLQKLLKDGDCPLLPQNMEEYERTLQFVFVKRPPLPRIFWRHLARRALERYDHHKSIFDYMTEHSSDWGDSIPALPHPTLLLHGRQDRVIHWSTSQALAKKLPESTLLVMDNVGHAAQWEAPMRTMSAIRNFLNTH